MNKAQIYDSIHRSFDGSNYKLLEQASGEQECARLVKQRVPDAMSVSFLSGNCYASNGTERVNHNAIRMCILFNL